MNRLLRVACFAVCGLLAACDGVSLSSLSSNASPAAVDANGSASSTSTSTSTASGGSIAFSAAEYSVHQAAGSIALTVNRVGGTEGAVSVDYATNDGTAKAGKDYTEKSGTLSWLAGDAAAKTIDVPVSTNAFNGSLTFDVALTQPTGGAKLGTAAATVAIGGSATSSAAGTPANGTLALASSAYAVPQSAGSVIGTDTSNGGADGTKSVTYALTNAAGGNFTGQDSGLIATLTGNHIFLYTEGNLIVGREGTGAVATGRGPPPVWRPRSLAKVRRPRCPHRHPYPPRPHPLRPQQACS